MKISICASAIALLIGTLLPLDASSQNRCLVVVSPRVGGVIDKTEATTYGLFPTIKNFHSASFYQAPDSALWVVAKLKSAEGIFLDSTFTISFEVVNEYAERIDHWEELLQGTYRMGTSQPQILCNDGTPLNPPPDASTKIVVSRRHVFADTLPLAPDTTGLVRPRFPTIRLDVAWGIMLSDLSELEQLTGRGSNITVPLSFYVQVPLMEDPSVRFIGGWSFDVTGRVISLSSVLLYRPSGFVSLKPIVGMGVGYTSYSYDGSVIINASESYPLLVLGMNITANTLDILLTYPLAKELNAAFESKSYTIKPAGLGLSLLLSL